MNREFIELYENELALLKGHATEFAAEYPGIAERLGGLVDDRLDPMMLGLLEGAAFLAARVQLKLKHEFPEFTNNLLEQLVPHYLAPTPSALLARIVPPYGDPALREGVRIPRGSYIDATYRERERRVACRYRLTSGVTLWPFEMTEAEYYGTPGPLQALGASVGPDVVAGLRLRLTHRMAGRAEDEPSATQADTPPEAWVAGCRMSELPVHLLGAEADAIALYEQLFARCAGLCIRWIDIEGKSVVAPMPPGSLEQIGFTPDEALLPNDRRVFRGFDLIREYFLLPRKFLGFRIRNLAKLLGTIRARSFDVLFMFGEVNPRLLAAVQPGMFGLYAAPAVNLFELSTDRVPVRSNQHEYHVVPDRSRPLDFEPHRILAVFAHHHGGHEKVPVQPLYSAQKDGRADMSLFYTIRRLSRQRTAQERQFGSTSDYIGTDMFLSLLEPAQLGSGPEVAELSIRALCSNRHLPEHLPVGEGGADFRLIDNTTLDVLCVEGPTPPREPITKQIRNRVEALHSGAVAWRLINMLSLNHLGLVQRGAGRDGRALREILSLFSNSSASSDRKVSGVRSIDSEAVVRRVRHRVGIGAARGIRITVTLDERNFEGSGAFLLGAVLDRFFAEYASMNHFTETVIRSTERGEIMRWPARAGERGPL